MIKFNSGSYVQIYLTRDADESQERESELRRVSRCHLLHQDIQRWALRSSSFLIASHDATESQKREPECCCRFRRPRLPVII